MYAVKLAPNGEEKYKARFVAKGYSQIPNVDYHETFSPTARITSVRMLMQLAVQDNLVVHQMDVKTAYLKAPRSKHIDIKYHFVRLEIQRGCVRLEYVQSEHNVADIFTKPAQKARLGKFAHIRGC